MKYCAFLRGVNVKGTNMKMADVCQIFEAAGMQEVTSVLASGNLIFSSEEKGSALKILLEKKMSEAFNYEAFLFICNQLDVETILRDCPFTAQENFHIYSFISEKKIENLLMEEFLKSNKAEGEAAEIVGEWFYWKAPKGETLSSDFGKILGKKHLKSQITSRNINTIEKILTKMTSK